MNIREFIAFLNVEASLFVKKLTIYNRSCEGGNIDANVYDNERFYE